MGVSMSNTIKQKPIKALTNYRRLAPEAVFITSEAILAHFDNNPNLTGAQPLPVDLAILKAANAQLSAKIAAAAEGGKTAVAEKHHQKDVVVDLLEQLAHYVEANFKGDMTTFLSFGFTPKATTKKKAPPVSESIRKVVPGPNSGEMELTLMHFPDAASYVIQWAQVVNGVTGSWTSRPVYSTKPPVLITGLTPGMTYVFQARAVLKDGYSDWSESVTRIVV